MSDNCIVPKCTRPASQHRRMCLLCYSRAKKFVEHDQTTWDKLEEMGLAGPDTASDPFTKAFNQAKEKDASSK